MTTLQSFRGILARFWSQVDKSGECWVWTGYCDKAGYGRFWDGDKLVRAHRFVYELLNGPTPSDVHVLHHCDNPSCVRPDHGFPGNPRINAEDREEKGRGRTAKLTLAQVQEARALYAAGGINCPALARFYGIEQNHMRRILNGQFWGGPRHRSLVINK